jgi:hypothetical protein
MLRTRDFLHANLLGLWLIATHILSMFSVIHTVLTLPFDKLFSDECHHDCELERKQSWPILRYYPMIFLEGLTESKNNLRISVIWAKY